MTIFDVAIDGHTRPPADLDRYRDQVIPVIATTWPGPQTDPQNGRPGAAIEKLQPRRDRR